MLRLPSRRVRRRVALGLVALLAAWWWVATRLERRAIARQDPRPEAAAALPDRADRERLMEVVRYLADPALEGRRTGSAGGRRARAFVLERFRELGLEPFAGSFEHPFSFVHHSIRGLVSPRRPFRTVYEGAANVLGTLPGTAAGLPAFVVSAHYDHLGVRGGRVYPGADDNASGVAVLLAAAEVLARHPPRHPTIFAAFDAEEQGTRGSEQFVAALGDARARVAIAVNFDMLSRNDRNEIFAAGAWRTPWLAALLDEVQARSAVRLLRGHDKPLWRAGGVEDWTGSSDHGPFAEAGVPYLYLGVEDHADYHRPTDTPDRIDPEFLDRVAETAIELLLTLDARL